MTPSLIIRKLTKEDCPLIEAAFTAQGWHKSESQYLRYLAYQESGERDILLAEWKQEFAGYLTISWTSHYPPFKEKGIPEIVDFNVLMKFQRKGIGTALMDEAERRIQSKSDFAGIGVGLTKDYGAAQILYIRRGYIPDGNGIVQHGHSLARKARVEIDDSLAICLSKKLK